MKNELRCKTEYETFRFTPVAGFPGVLGCIDCTHVAIKKDAYKNHHGFYSLNVQMICDEQLRILNVNANFPGSVHKRFRICCRKTHAYAGIKCSAWITRRAIYANALSRSETGLRDFSEYKKARWRCLRRDRVLHYQPQNAAYIIYTCAIFTQYLFKQLLFEWHIIIFRQPFPDIDFPELPEAPADLQVQDRAQATE
ncbi:hypothetical protein NQ317_001074 [Molorchus minor]|uniref:DDE Tnp4 domain-containing protein n=1 Tax=Molorchus minor TaxID=1323400 RepID=A0ABQ9JQ28_9CUCU|nr:hypothetical protein NQ317_001074 [Molorchus minor]